jgi:hypothetical protein
MYSRRLDRDGVNSPRHKYERLLTIIFSSSELGRDEGRQKGAPPPNEEFVLGLLRAFPGRNIVDATEEQAILDILDNHPNRHAALGELEALANERLARLGGVYEDHTGPREDARELQRADYQRIREVCGLDLTKELSLTRYKGHEQATAIARTKAAYPWMTALEAKAAIVKAVSAYKHEAMRSRNKKKPLDKNDVVLGANTFNHSLGKSSGVTRVRFGGVRNFGFESSIKGFGFSERLAADNDNHAGVDGGRLTGSDVKATVDSDEESTSDSSD